MLSLGTRDFELEKVSKRVRGIPQWWILSEKVIPEPQDVSKVREEIESQLSGAAAGGKLESVFNPGPNRYQLPLSSKHALIVQLLAALAHDGALARRSVGKSVALYSSEGCEQQLWHADFDPNPTLNRKSRSGNNGYFVRSFQQDLAAPRQTAGQ